MDVYTLAQVNIATTAAVDLLIDQISDQRISMGIRKLLVGADGNVDPTYTAIAEQNPTANFTTSALATVLATVGIDGLKIDSDVDDDGLEMWFQKLAEGATRASGSNHIKMTVNEGLLVPTRIVAPHNGVATLELLLIITYDGTNEPIVLAASQALEGSPSVGELFTAGTVNLNGNQIEGVQNIEIDFGIRPLTVSADGVVWPTYAAIQSREPAIRVRTIDATYLQSLIGLDGLAQSATDSVIYLRKLDEGGTRVTNATAEHISFTVDEGMFTVNEVGGAHPKAQMAEIEIQPTYDGTNAILVISTATAIT